MYSRSHQQKRDYKKCSIIVQKPFRRANINNGAIPPGAKGANKFLEMPNVQSSVNKGHLWQNIHDIESMAGGINNQSYLPYVLLPSSAAKTKNVLTRRSYTLENSLTWPLRKYFHAWIHSYRLLATHFDDFTTNGYVYSRKPEWVRAVGRVHEPGRRFL